MTDLFALDIKSVMAGKKNSYSLSGMRRHDNFLWNEIDFDETTE